jgi:hypothetical protein
MTSELFSYEPDEAIQPQLLDRDSDRELREEIMAPEKATYAIREQDDFATRYAAQFGGEIATAQTAELRDQFFIFQLNDDPKGPAVLEPTEVAPSIKGSDDQPDVLMRLAMESLHVGKQEPVSPETKATTRVAVGEDSSVSRGFETLTWTLAAGLDLWDQYKNEQTQHNEMKADSHEAFGGSPIELVGGVGKLSFEVVKHKNPPWWRDLFKLAQDPTVNKLVSLVGFPAITLSAVSFVDGLLSKLLGSEDPDVLFKGRPMKLALTEKGRDELTAGLHTVKAGCVNPGFLVLARGRDRDEIVAADVEYHSELGVLIPRGKRGEEIYDDALPEVTYAIMRLKMKQAKLTRTEDL